MTRRTSLFTKECNLKNAAVVLSILALLGISIGAVVLAAQSVGWRVTFQKKSYGFVASSDDAKTVLIVKRDAACEVWNSDTQKKVTVLSGHSKRLLYAVFTKDGKRIATAGEDGTSRVWNAETGEQLLVLEEKERAISYVRFLDGGKKLLTISDGEYGRKMEPTSTVDSLVRFLDTKTGNKLDTFSIKGAKYLSIVFSPDEKTFLSAHYNENGVLRMWDSTTLKQLHVYKAKKPWSVCMTAFSPNGKRIVSNVGGMVHVWDVETEKLLHVTKGHLLACHFAENRSWFLTNHMDRSHAKIYEVETGKEVLSLAHGKTPISAAFSPDGSQIAVGGEKEDKTVSLWNVETGEKAGRLKSPVSVVWIKLFANKDRIVTMSDDGSYDPPRMMTIRFWARKGK